MPGTRVKITYWLDDISMINPWKIYLYLIKFISKFILI